MCRFINVVCKSCMYSYNLSGHYNNKSGRDTVFRSALARDKTPSFSTHPFSSSSLLHLSNILLDTDAWSDGRDADERVVGLLKCDISTP